MRVSLSSVLKVFSWVSDALFRLVQIWPCGGTYWRGSCGIALLAVVLMLGSHVWSLYGYVIGGERPTSHIRQLSGGEVRGLSYCVPQVTQVARSPLSNFIVAK
jgi:hypothetical protein